MSQNKKLSKQNPINCNCISIKSLTQEGASFNSISALKQHCNLFQYEKFSRRTAGSHEKCSYLHDNGLCGGMKLSGPHIKTLEEFTCRKVNNITSGVEVGCLNYPSYARSLSQSPAMNCRFHSKGHYRCFCYSYSRAFSSRPLGTTEDAFECH